MPTVRTNLLRMEFNPSHFLYEVEITSKSSIENYYLEEIARYIAQILPQALFNYPHIYSPTAIAETILHTHLSNGVAVMLQLTQFPSNTSNPALAPLIAQKLMSFTNMLFSDIFQAYFNPFQERIDRDRRIIVGWKIGTERSETANMFRVQALQLILSSPGALGEQSEVLMDYDTGNFLLKQNIVRIDKGKGQVLFRNGELCRREVLYSASILPLNGFPLASNIDNILGRIKETSIDFSKQWAIKFDSRLVEVSGTYASVGVLGFRQNAEKPTSELVSPMNEPNYENNLVHLFSGVSFEDILRANLVYLVQNDRQDTVMGLKKQIDKISSRMALQINSKVVVYNGLIHLQQLLTVLHNQPCEPHINRIYFIEYNHHRKQKVQHQQYENLVQFLINNTMPYHLLETNSKKQHNFQTLAYHHLPIIYTKCRLNPWKLKNIPFLSQPMMLVTLHIQITRQKLHSVAIVATMNVFFTKFTAIHKITTKDTLNQAVQKGLLQCIQNFKSKHQRYPHRVFLIRSGAGAEDDLNLQNGKAEVRLRGGQLTYVTLFNDHGIRMFNQLDSNYVSKESVKKVQLFLYATINKELYYQIQLERPAYRVRVNQIEQNDPNFVQKILELISRVVLGGVGHSYGKGLGILDYPRKLNRYRQYNLMPWQGFLTEGILIFL